MDTSQVEFDDGATLTTRNLDTREGEILDSLSMGCVLALETGNDPSVPDPLIVTPAGTEQMQNSAGRTVIHVFKGINNDMEFGMEESDFERSMTKRVRGSDQQVVDAIDSKYVSLDDVATLPDSKLVDYLINADADPGLYTCKYHVGFPVLWHLERNEDEWDDVDGELYGDIDVGDVALWNDATDCPHTNDV